MVAKDLKQSLREKPFDKQLFLGSYKFVQRNRAQKNNALLASSLRRFGWVFGGSITSKQVWKSKTWTANNSASNISRKMAKGSQER